MSREAATRSLKERVEAIPALRKMRQTTNLETRRRVDDILSALDRIRARRCLDKANALGKAGRAVELADRLAFAASCNVPCPEGWGGLTQFADQTITRTDRFFSQGGKFHRDQVFPAGDFRLFAKQGNLKEIAARSVEINTGKKRDNSNDMKAIAGRRLIQETTGKLLLRGESVSLTGDPGFGLLGGMIAASGDIRLSGASFSVIIAGGDVKQVAQLRHCILICDGDVEFLDRAGAHDSIIVARGKVTYNRDEFWLQNCLIRSGHTLFLPEGHPPKRKPVDLKDGTPDPLAFVKFFELADVGLAAEDIAPRDKLDTASVRLKDVRKDSPFASGLRVGDVMLAIDEKKTPTTEVFRRVLRRTLAEGGPLLTFTVRRAGKTLEVPIPVKD